jgi:transposase-like protein
VARISSFTPEFREEAVQLVRESNRPIAHVAKELEVNPETLRNWVRRYEHQHTDESAELAVSERARLKELERRNRELEMENSFLKKAAAYFAKDHR